MTDTIYVVDDDQDMTVPGPWRRYRAAMQSALACSPEIWDRVTSLEGAVIWMHGDGHWTHRHVSIVIPTDGDATITTTDAQGQPCAPSTFAVRERDLGSLQERLADVADVQAGLDDGTTTEVYRSGVPIPEELCGSQIADYLLADGRTVRGQGWVPDHLHDVSWDRDAKVLGEHLGDIKEIARQLPTLCSVARRAALWARCVVVQTVEETHMACLKGGRVPLIQGEVGCSNIPGILEGTLPIGSATELADVMTKVIASWSPTWTGENSLAAIWGTENLKHGLNGGPIQYPCEDGWESRWAPDTMIGVTQGAIDAGPTMIAMPGRSRMEAWCTARVVRIPTPTAGPEGRLVDLLTQWQIPGYIYQNAKNIINRAIELKIVTVAGLAAGFAQARFGLDGGVDTIHANVWETRIAAALAADPETEVPNDGIALACDVIELAGDVIPWIAWDSAWERRRGEMDQWRCKIAGRVAKRLMKPISDSDDRCVLYRLVARSRELQVGMMLNGTEDDAVTSELVELSRCLVAVMATADDPEWMGEAEGRRSHIKRYLKVHGMPAICARMVENPAVEEELTSILTKW